MQLDAAMGSTMTERFNVAGALLVKLFGRPEEETTRSPGGPRGSATSACSPPMYGRVFFVALTLVAALATALVYGLGGELAIHGAVQLGTLVALAALLSRLYGPLTALSNVQVDVMTALVSFDRVFEVLDLKPLVADAPGACRCRLPGQAARPIEFDRRLLPLPGRARGVAGLAGVGRAARARAQAGPAVLHDVSFRAAPGS